MPATATARFAPPRTLRSGAVVIDVTVQFAGFPAAGATPFNQPHASISTNGDPVHENQPMFNTSTYQLDAERVAVKAGDLIAVRAWWDATETRDGSSQPPTVVAQHRHA